MAKNNPYKSPENFPYNLDIGPPYRYNKKKGTDWFWIAVVIVSLTFGLLWIIALTLFVTLV